jgi:hypothetical protein
MDRALTKIVAGLLAVPVIFLVAGVGLAEAQDSPWERIANGLELGQFKVEDESVAGDSTITILRIDPARWELRLLSASQTGEPTGLNAKEWCEKYNLAAATNAGMFQQDHSTHVGYMKSGSHINCPRKNSYKSAAAFGPLRKDIPLFRIFDLDVDNIDSIISRYTNVIQNIRMINRAGENRWSQQDREWSEAALGEDREGRALFIFSRSPYAMHDLNRILLSLPIGLVCAQHLEGGPEAQVYLRWGKTEVELTGSYETSFSEDDLNQIAWPVPNVIGIVPKEK